jgi:hypothetical protein
MAENLSIVSTDHENLEPGTLTQSIGEFTIVTILAGGLAAIRISSKMASEAMAVEERNRKEKPPRPPRRPNARATLGSLALESP